MTALGLYKLLFVAELLVSFFIFGFRLKKRRFFYLRSAAAVALLFIVAYFFPLAKYNAGYSSFMFLCLFAASLVLLYFCYDEPPLNILFVGIAAYTTRHMAFQVFGIIKTVFDSLGAKVIGASEGKTAFFLYGDGMLRDVVIGKTALFYGCIYLAVYVAAYYFAYFFIGRALHGYDDLKISNKSILALSGFVLLAEILLHALLVYITDGYNAVYTVITYAYNILSCLFIFYLQKSLLSEKQLQKELTLVNHMLQQEREQYEVSKENIELINMKCHDIRHQIRQVFAQNIDREYLAEIEKLISIYDSTVKTGNKELDVILTEKSLVCTQKNITFACIVDGKLLSFMDKTDIYALFGNLIDNAMEAVTKLTDAEKRIIDLTVRGGGDNMVAISVSNYFDGNLVTDVDGLPATTKGNKEYHGFGLKSIRYIVQKYNGDLSISTHDNLFTADIVLLRAATTQSAG